MEQNSKSSCGIPIQDLTCPDKRKGYRGKNNSALTTAKEESGCSRVCTEDMLEKHGSTYNRPYKHTVKVPMRKEQELRARRTTDQQTLRKKYVSLPKLSTLDQRRAGPIS